LDQRTNQQSEDLVKLNKEISKEEIVSFGDLKQAKTVVMRGNNVPASTKINSLKKVKVLSSLNSSKRSDNNNNEISAPQLGFNKNLTVPLKDEIMKA
jgi:hypothetical protein